MDQRLKVMTIRLPYALATMVVFVIEVFIALFVRDRFIRPYIGDVLAVVLVYLALRAVTTLRVVPALAITLAIAAAIEFGQLFNLLGALGLRHNQIARIILGGSFDVQDFAAYAVGACSVVLVEWIRKARMN
jgi:hypothetical protein